MILGKRKTIGDEELNKVELKTIELKSASQKPIENPCFIKKEQKKKRLNRKILKSLDHLNNMQALKNGLIDHLNEEFKELEENGFQVVPNLIEYELCDRLVQEMKDWVVETRNPWVKADDITTWNPSNLPYFIKRFICQQYGAGQAKWSWEIRQHPKIYNVFSRLWQTKELLVSFDAFSLGAPHELTGARLYSKETIKKQKTASLEEKVEEAKKMVRWDHFDQAPCKQGLWCIQGMTNLIEIGPEDACFSVWKYSHHFFEEYCQAFPPKDNKQMFDDGQTIDEKGVEWLKNQVFCKVHGKNKCKTDNCSHSAHPELVRVVMPKGSLVLWDSRSAHFAGQPIAKRENPIWRATVYTCFMPRKFAREEVIKRRIELFRQGMSTNHWPITCTEFMSQPFLIRDKLLCDGTNCKIENNVCVNLKHVKMNVPRILEENLSELGKKLVGLIPY